MTASVQRALAAALVAVAALLCLVAVPAAAWAHPEVTETVPLDGATLARAPDQVSVTFGSEFEAPIASLKVYDRDSQRVDNDDAAVYAEHPRTVVATTGDLPAGTYLVIWRAVGLDDGHTVIGRFSFSVGAEHDSSVAAAVAGDLGTGAGGRVLGLVRFAGLAGALLAVGAGMLVVATLRGRSGRGWREVSASVRRLVTIGARVAVAAAVLQLPAEAYLRAGGMEGFTAALATTLGSAVGLSVAVRIVALLPFALPLRTTSPVLVLGLWTVALSGFVVEGHSISEEPFLAVAGADMVHLAAGAVWFGGLVALGVVLRRAEPTRDAAGVAEVVSWFSGAAAAAVVAAGLAGVVLAAVGVGSVAAATTTTYGLLVLAKIALVAGIVAIGAYNRFALVPRIRGGVRPVPEGASATVVRGRRVRTVSLATDAFVVLRRTVRIEAVLLLGVLVLTVLLAGQPTP